MLKSTFLQISHADIWMSWGVVFYGLGVQMMPDSQLAKTMLYIIFRTSDQIKGCKNFKMAKVFICTIFLCDYVN